MKPLWQENEAVAQIVGAVLLFGLVASMFVVVRTEFVPTWERDAEAEHMAEVMATFQRLHGETDRLIGNGTTTRAMLSLPMVRTTGVPILESDPVPARVSFERGSGTVTMASSQMRFFEIDGSFVRDAEESWVTIPPSGSINDIGQIEHLRIRVVDPQGQPSGASATLRVIDHSGREAGMIRIHHEKFPSGYTIKTQTTTAAGSVVYDQGESFFNQDRPPFYWIDALRSEVQFIDVLRASDWPVTLTLTQDRLDAQYTTAYRQGSASGGGIVGSAGKTQMEWTTTIGGGSLVYESANRFMPDRRVTYEGGAILVSQNDGGLVREGGAPKVTRSGDLTRIEVDLAVFHGGGDGASTRRATTVSLEAATRTSHLGTAPDWSYTIQTGRPDLWAEQWHDQLAPILDQPGEFTVSTGADWARLTIYGAAADPTSIEHDLIVAARVVEIDMGLSS